MSRPLRDDLDTILQLEMNKSIRNKAKAHADRTLRERHREEHQRLYDEYLNADPDYRPQYRRHRSWNVSTAT